MHLNLDRQTGLVKGYCLIEYESYKEAKQAIERMNGVDFRGETLGVSWAFSKGAVVGKRTRTEEKKNTKLKNTKAGLLLCAVSRLLRGLQCLWRQTSRGSETDLFPARLPPNFMHGQIKEEGKRPFLIPAAISPSLVGRESKP